MKRIIIEWDGDHIVIHDENGPLSFVDSLGALRFATIKLETHLRMNLIREARDHEMGLTKSVKVAKKTGKKVPAKKVKR